MKLNMLTGEIVGAAIEVHRELGGPGLLEEVYESAMVYELKLRGLAVEQQVAVPVLYKGHNIKKPHYLDLLVEGRVIVELKADYTVVIVTHNMQQASRISDYTAFFYLGELIEFDKTKTIFTNPKVKQTENYITGRFG